MAKSMNRVSVMMLGESAVGKTSIVLQYCEHNFLEYTKSTIGESESLCLTVYPRVMLSKESL